MANKMKKLLGRDHTFLFGLLVFFVICALIAYNQHMSKQIVRQSLLADQHTKTVHTEKNYEDKSYKKHVDEKEKDIHERDEELRLAEHGKSEYDKQKKEEEKEEAMAATANATVAASDHHRNLDAYKRLHERILDGSSPAVAIRLSINMLDNNGYGNRVYSVLSSLLIALVTDSAFFVARWPWVVHYIDEPFNMTFRYENATELRERVERARINETLVYPVQGWNVRKDLDAVTGYRVKDEIPSDAARLFLFNELSGHFMTICAQPAYYEKLYAYGLVGRATIDDAYAKLQSAQHSNDTKLDSVFSVGFEVAGNILNKHWLPKADLARRINVTYEKLFGTVRQFYTIGVQVRTFFMNNGSDLRAFLDCVHGVEKRVSSERGDVKFKWYIASDNSKYIDQMQATYPDRVLRPNVTDHMPYDHTESIIYDIELLSRCDELIVTGGSTFGFMAAMKMQKMPLYVNGRANMTQCRRAVFHSLPHTYSNDYIYSSF